MKKALVLALAVFATVAHADWRNAEEPFNASNKMTEQSQIKWVTVSDVQGTCEKESRRRGNGGFGYPVQACTFWDKTSDGYQCTMITAKNPSIHTMGHEVRHCFQGNYH